MKPVFKKGSQASVLLISAMAFASPAKAAHYEFSQGGYVTKLFVDNKLIKTFSDGKISGSFDGADSVDFSGNQGKDGLILGASSDTTEISNFTFSLTGNDYFNSFYGNGLYFDEYGITYNTVDKTLALNLSWEGSYNPDFMATLTGDTFLDFTGNSLLDVSGQKSNLYSGAIYIDGLDKEGNPIDVLKQFILNSTSDEKMVVSVIQTPLPGALLFFVSGLAGLVFSKRKKS